MSGVDRMRYFDEIAKKAQELSRKKERAESHELDIWLEAERIILAREYERRRNIEETMPVQRSWTRL